MARSPFLENSERDGEHADRGHTEARVLAQEGDAAKRAEDGLDSPQGVEQRQRTIQTKPIASDEHREHRQEHHCRYGHPHEQAREELHDQDAQPLELPAILVLVDAVQAIGNEEQAGHVAKVEVREKEQRDADDEKRWPALLDNPIGSP